MLRRSCVLPWSMPVARWSRHVFSTLFTSKLRRNEPEVFGEQWLFQFIAWENAIRVYTYRIGLRADHIHQRHPCSTRLLKEFGFLKCTLLDLSVTTKATRRTVQPYVYFKIGFRAVKTGINPTT